MGKARYEQPVKAGVEMVAQRLGGAQAGAVGSCRGVHGVGSDEKMMLNGGRGRADGICGSGTRKVRTVGRGLAKKCSDKDSVSTFGRGILIQRFFF